MPGIGLVLVPMGVEDVVRVDLEAAAQQCLAIALEALASRGDLRVSGEHADLGVADVEQVADRAEARGTMLDEDAVRRHPHGIVVVEDDGSTRLDELLDTIGGRCATIHHQRIDAV